MVFLSAFSNDRYIESALQAHATGYVTKDERPGVVIQAVRSAAADVAYFSPKIQARLVVDTDGLHLSDEGYKLWSELLRPHLAVLGCR